MQAAPSDLCHHESVEQAYRCSQIREEECRAMLQAHSGCLHALQKAIVANQSLETRGRQ